jgi:hypothetical protein
MRRYLFALVVPLVVVSSRSVWAQTVYGESSDLQYPQSPSFTSPAPLVYGQSQNSFGGGAFGSAIQKGLPIAQTLLSGGGFQGAIPGLLQLGQTYLPSNIQQYAGLASPIIQNLLSGGGVNLGGLISNGLPILSQQLGLSAQTSGIIGSAAPLVSDLLSGHFNVGSLVNTGMGIASQFLGNNPIFGTVSGVFGGLFGGGGQKGTGIEVSPTMQQVSTAAITSAISSQLFAGSQDDGNTVLAQSGSILCLYNIHCVQSNPREYRGLYGNAIGAMGIANPNQVRGQISQLSASGVKPDAFSTDSNSEENAWAMGSLSDREISRASTQPYLSQAGQASIAKSIQSANTLGAQMAALGDKCDPAASTQDLVRCSMKMTSTNAGFQSAQLELQHKSSIDNQMIKNSLGNISDATDKLSRSEDVEFSAAAQKFAQDATFSIPVTGKD